MFDGRFAQLCHTFHFELRPFVLSRQLLAFLEQTAYLEETAAERLRRLALFVGREQPWSVVEVILRVAAALEPRDVTLFLTWGLLARDHAEGVEDVSAAQEIVESGESALARALALSPEDVRVGYAIGLMKLSHGGGSHRPDPSAALVWLTRALGWVETEEDTRGFRQIVRFYIGHCHYAMRAWEQAEEWYALVEREVLEKHWPGWCGGKLLERQVCVSAYRGELEEAKARLDAFAQEIEAWEEEGERMERVPELDDLAVAAGLFPDVLLEKTKQMVPLFGLEEAYDWASLVEQAEGPAPYIPADGDVEVAVSSALEAIVSLGLAPDELTKAFAYVRPPNDVQRVVAQLREGSVALEDVIRAGILSGGVLYHFLCDCVEEMLLQAWEAGHAPDERSLAAVEVGRRWIEEKASHGDLFTAARNASLVDALTEPGEEVAQLAARAAVELMAFGDFETKALRILGHVDPQGQRWRRQALATRLCEEQAGRTRFVSLLTRRAEALEEPAMEHARDAYEDILFG